MNKSQLIKHIAKDTNLRRDVVEDVLESFISITISEIVNKGKFNINGLLSISSSKWGSYKIKDKEIPSHLRLKIRLSNTVRTLFKEFGLDSDKRGFLDHKNWKELYSYIRKNKTNN